MTVSVTLRTFQALRALTLRDTRQLEEWLQQEVDIIDLFRYPSVSRLASRLNSLRDAPPTVNAATRRGNTRRIPLRRRKSADTD